MFIIVIAFRCYQTGPHVSISVNLGTLQVNKYLTILFSNMFKVWVNMFCIIEQGTHYHIATWPTVWQRKWDVFNRWWIHRNDYHYHNYFRRREKKEKSWWYSILLLLSSFTPAVGWVWVEDVWKITFKKNSMVYPLV